MARPGGRRPRRVRIPNCRLVDRTVDQRIEEIVQGYRIALDCLQRQNRELSQENARLRPFEDESQRQKATLDRLYITFMKCQPRMEGYMKKRQEEDHEMLKTWSQFFVEFPSTYGFNADPIGARPSSQFQERNSGYIPDEHKPASKDSGEGCREKVHYRFNDDLSTLPEERETLTRRTSEGTRPVLPEICVTSYHTEKSSSASQGDDVAASDASTYTVNVDHLAISHADVSSGLGTSGCSSTPRRDDSDSDEDSREGQPSLTSTPIASNSNQMLKSPRVSVILFPDSQVDMRRRRTLRHSRVEQPMCEVSSTNETVTRVETTSPADPSTWSQFGESMPSSLSDESPTECEAYSCDLADKAFVQGEQSQSKVPAGAAGTCDEPRRRPKRAAHIQALKNYRAQMNK